MKALRLLVTGLALTFVVAAGCGTDTASEDNDDAHDDQDPPPIEPSMLERCVSAGGTISELWSTGNLHGAVTSIAVNGSTIVLGSIDGSVKQWTVEAETPSYGTPLIDESDSVVSALAFADDEVVVGVDQRGQLSEWRVSDAAPLRTTPMTETALHTVSVSRDGKHVAVGDAGDVKAAIRVFERSSGELSELLPSELWEARAVEFGADSLFTAGHMYQWPLIERRAADEPMVVIETWNEVAMGTFKVNALATDPGETVLVAALEGRVAVFDPETLANGPSVWVDVPDHNAIGVTLLPGNELFATVGQEGTLRVWKITGELVTNVPIAEPVGVARDGSGDTLYTAGPDGMLRAFGCR
ncbi:MAG: WD40 repeat domain-containing protein [Kofleriaceae bacterium]